MPTKPDPHRWGRKFMLDESLSKLRHATTADEKLRYLQRIAQSADLLNDINLKWLVDEYIDLSDPRHRGELCYLLGLSGHGEYIPRIQGRIADDNSWVHAQAVRALQRLAASPNAPRVQEDEAATIYRVFIASPSDVTEERRAVHDVIEIWNSTHSRELRVFLHAEGWDTDALPLQDGYRPQESINRLVDESQVLVAFFWTRLGTPTGNAVCGTAEEIQRFRDTGKPALLYFSSCAIPPDQIDPDQFKRLLRFKRECKLGRLYKEYRSIYEFRELLQRHICQVVYALRQKSAKL